MDSCNVYCIVGKLLDTGFRIFTGHWVIGVLLHENLYYVVGCGWGREVTPVRLRATVRSHCDLTLPFRLWFVRWAWAVSFIRLPNRREGHRKTGLERSAWLLVRSWLHWSTKDFSHTDRIPRVGVYSTSHKEFHKIQPSFSSDPPTDRVLSVSYL